MDVKQSGLLLVGNLQPDLNTNPTVCDELVNIFGQKGWRVLATSKQSNKLYKLVDMVGTCITHRKEYDIALVDVYSTLAFFWAEVVSTLLRHLRKKYVLTLHGGNLPSFASHHPNRVKCLFHHANAVTTPSEYLQSTLSGFRKDIRLIPNPLDIGCYEFKQRNTVTPSLIWVRAFHHLYNPCLALQATKILKSTFPEIRLLMVGPDKRDGSLDEFSRMMLEFGLQQQVTILGSIPKTEIPKILHRGDIFINTTHVDNTPVSVLEAMASGLCVVSTNVGGIPYLLTHGQDSLLVPPDDAPAMASSISEIINSASLAQKISLNARRKAEEKDLNKTIELWEAIFLELQND